MTEDFIIERGLEAETLLSLGSFLSFTEELRKYSGECFLNTQPEDTKVREELYYTMKGLSDLVGIMQSYVAAKDEIIAKRNAAEDLKEMDTP